MVILNKYNLNQFIIYKNSLDNKQNKFYNLYNFNFDFKYKKKVMRSFLMFFFVFYSCMPYNFFAFLNKPSDKLIIKENITLLSENKEFSYFYKKFN